MKRKGHSKGKVGKIASLGALAKKGTATSQIQPNGNRIELQTGISIVVYLDGDELVLVREFGNTRPEVLCRTTRERIEFGYGGGDGNGGLEFEGDEVTVNSSGAPLGRFDKRILLDAAKEAVGMPGSLADDR